MTVFQKKSVNKKCKKVGKKRKIATKKTTRKLKNCKKRRIHEKMWKTVEKKSSKTGKYERKT